MSLTANELISIGYEGRDLGGLVTALTERAVEVVVDVRLTPLSRKRGLSKSALRDALAVEGIEYVHERDLGNPKENREPFRNGDVLRGRRRFFERLDNGSGPAFDRVVELMGTRKVALLCYERDEQSCHRQCIVERAVERGRGLQVVRL